MNEATAVANVVTDAATESGELAEGWCTVSLLRLCEVIRGVSYKKGEAANQPAPGLVPLLRANNIGDGLNTRDLQYVPQARVSQEQLLRLGDVVVAMSSGSKSVVGKAGSVEQATGSTFGAFCGVLRPVPEIDARYFGFFFQSRAYRNYISEASSGTNINNLKREHFAKIDFPLPPLAEQKRIVAEIERLLAEVNKAREHLDRVPKLLKRFRQSILAAAIDGELTGDWRLRQPSLPDAAELLKRIQGERSAFERNTRSRDVEDVQPVDRELPAGWVWMRVADGLAYGRSAAYGVLQPGDDVASGVPFVRVCDLSKGTVLVNQLKKIAPSIDAQYARTRLLGGEILVSLVGTIGRTAVAPREVIGANVARAVAMLPLCPHVIPEYLNIALSEPKTNYQLTDLSREVARKTLNLGLLKGVQVPLPTLAEQREIVTRVQKVMAEIDAIEETVADATREAEAAPQAILAKAFRGELVPTEAELARTENRPYESATQLLARISSTTGYEPKSGTNPKARKRIRQTR